VHFSIANRWFPILTDLLARFIYGVLKLTKCDHMGNTGVITIIFLYFFVHGFAAGPIPWFFVPGAFSLTLSPAAQAVLAAVHSMFLGMVDRITHPIGSLFWIGLTMFSAMPRSLDSAS
jgi:hypothetical protein